MQDAAFKYHCLLWNTLEAWTLGSCQSMQPVMWEQEQHSHSISCIAALTLYTMHWQTSKPALCPAHSICTCPCLPPPPPPPASLMCFITACSTCCRRQTERQTHRQTRRHVHYHRGNSLQIETSRSLILFGSYEHTVLISKPPRGAVMLA